MGVVWDSGRFVALTSYPKPTEPLLLLSYAPGTRDWSDCEMMRGMSIALMCSLLPPFVLCTHGIVSYAW